MVVTVAVKIFTSWAVHAFQITSDACCWAFRSFGAMDHVWTANVSTAGGRLSFVQVIKTSVVHHRYHVPTIQENRATTAAAQQRQQRGAMAAACFLRLVACCSKIGGCPSQRCVVRPHEKNKYVISYQIRAPLLCACTSCRCCCCCCCCCCMRFVQNTT